MFRDAQARAKDLVAEGKHTPDWTDFCDDLSLLAYVAIESLNIINKESIKERNRIVAKAREQIKEIDEGKRIPTCSPEKLPSEENIAQADKQFAEIQRQTQNIKSLLKNLAANKKISLEDKQNIKTYIKTNLIYSIKTSAIVKKALILAESAGLIAEPTHQAELDQKHTPSAKTPLLQARRN